MLFYRIILCSPPPYSSLQFVSPMCYAHIYSEKLVHLPHCYFVNDYKQVNDSTLVGNFLFRHVLHLLWMEVWGIFIPLMMKFSICRKILMYQIQIASPRDQIMVYQRINLSSLALISFIRWILKFSQPGKFWIGYFN